MSPEPGRKELERMAGDALADPSAGRRKVADGLRRFRERLLELGREGFPAGSMGRDLSRFLRQGCDIMVENAVEHVAGDVDGLAAWVATGGYGTGLMSPGSTVRLALVHDADDPEGPRKQAADVAALLREAGLRVACAARTVPELLHLMETDAETAVSMLQTRRVTGSRNIHRSLREGIRSDFLPEYWGSLFEETLNEILTRRDPLTGSPYCTEPNLKEGSGCLRDIGAARKMDDALGEVASLREYLDSDDDGLLTLAQRQALGRAQSVILRVRNALHLAGPGSPDLLHRHVQADVARELGFGDGPGAPSALLEALFRQTGRVTGILQALNERFLHLHRVAWRRSRQLARRDLGSGFAEVEGYIYSAREPTFAGDEAAPAMLGLFRLSQRRHLPISRRLLDQVSDRLDAVTEEFRREEEAGRAFLDLLGGSVGVAERLAWMRDCGLLQAYLPELQPLVHKIDAEAAGELTLDEHAIEAVRVIDELSYSKEPADIPQRQTLEQVERTDLLRLLILLHDLDLVTDQDPAGVASAIAGRLGVRRQGCELLADLMGLKDVLWERVLAGGEPDESELRRMAERIGSPEKLRKLYLLTYAHGRAMGSLGWFAWHDAKLFEVYQGLMAVLVPGYEPVATSDYFDRELAQAAAREGLEAPAERHASLVPDTYKTEVAPSVALEHVRMVQRLDGRPAAMTWAIHEQQAVVWVCTSDVPARFAQIAGIFTHNGLDILSATAFTLEDGTVLDRFTVRMKDRPINPDPNFWGAVEDDLVLAIDGQLEVAPELREKAEEKSESDEISSHRSIASVHFDNRRGRPFTAVDIVARDRVGLLFSLADALGAEGLDIEFAQILTRGELARDVFFVTDAGSGRPVTDEARLESIRQAVMAATE
ncbi:MAG: hypothetical protein R6X33_14960 [Candidatus Brocadiia bacterium]